MRGLKKSVPVLFLLLVSLAFLWEASFFKKAFFYFDIVGYNLPLRQILGEQIREGGFPLWSQRMFCGFPVFAEGQGGFLYPPNLLLFPFLEAWKAFNLSMVLNFFLGSYFMYAYLKRKVQTFPALVGSVVFAYSGYFMCHSIHTAQVNVAIWVPLLFLFADRALEGRGLRSISIGACILTVMIFAGHTHACLISLVGISLYLLYRGLFSARIKGLAICLLVLVLLVLLGVGMGAVQLLPMAEVMGESGRSGKLPYEFLVQGSFSPAFFTTLFIPDLFGSRGSDTVWFAGYFPYHEMDIYLGILPLLLLIVALIHVRDRRILIWFALWITSIVLMLGKYTPLYHIFSYLPYFDRMRLPSKFGLLFCFSSSVLIAFGTEYLFGGRRLKVAPLVIAVLLILVFVCVVYWVTYDGVFGKLKDVDASRFSPGVLERLERLKTLIITDTVLAILFLAIGLSIILAAGFRFSHSKLLAGISLIFILINLFLYSRTRIGLIEPAFYTEMPPTLAPLHNEEGPFRIYSDDIFEGFSYAAPGWLNTKRPYFYSLYTLPYDTQVIFGVSSIRGGSPLRLRRVDRAIRGYRRSLIDMLNGRYIFTWRKLPGDDLELVYGAGPYVYRNLRALERAIVVPRAIFARSGDEAFGVVMGESFRPGEAVVIEGAGSENFQLAGRESHGITVEPEITGYSPHEVVVEIDMPYNGFLVLSDAYYPGWHAEDNGSAALIYRANYLVRAVYLEEGSHRVRFFYSPASFRLGLFLSILSFVVALLLWCVGGRRTAGFFAQTEKEDRVSRVAMLLVVAVLAILLILSLIVEAGFWRDAFMTLRIR